MYITIEGPIGAGKTTLTSIIAEKSQYKRITEVVEQNPFLSRFYENPDKWAFQTEMFFLSHRYNQLNNIDAKYISQGKSIVSDYNIHKNLIFARKNLSQNEYKKFEHIFEILTQDLATPDITIFLTASLETLYHRIGIRGRDFEENINDEYLTYLIDAYNEYITYCREKFPDNILVIDCNKFDFVHSDCDRENIMNKIEKKISFLKEKNEKCK